MSRRGFTLMELQAALYLGIVVASLAGLLLFYEWERQVRVQHEERLQAVIQRADATLQWLLTVAEKGEVAPTRLICHWDGEPWIFDGKGVHHGTRSLFNDGRQADFSAFTVDGIDLHCRLVAREGERRREVTLIYRLPPWWSR